MRDVMWDTEAKNQFLIGSRFILKCEPGHDAPIAGKLDSTCEHLIARRK